MGGGRRPQAEVDPHHDRHRHRHRGGHPAHLARRGDPRLRPQRVHAVRHQPHRHQPRQVGNHRREPGGHGREHPAAAHRGRGGAVAHPAGAEGDAGRVRQRPRRARRARAQRARLWRHGRHAGGVALHGAPGPVPAAGGSAPRRGGRGARLPAQAGGVRRGQRARRAHPHRRPAVPGHRRHAAEGELPQHRSRRHRLPAGVPGADAPEPRRPDRDRRRVPQRPGDLRRPRGDPPRPQGSPRRGGGLHHDDPAVDA